MAEKNHLRADGRRLWESLMDMAKIGATRKGGSRRLALSDEDKSARDLFIDWCKRAGCSIRIDRIGNVFARRSGRQDDLAPVMTGSHLDTQPTGGRFDGVYGVLSGLEVIRRLNDLNYETERPIEVVVWTNEEGSRFPPAMVASGVFAGVFSLDYGLSRTDPEGKTVGEELTRIGYAGSEEVGGRDIHAFFELHIEQGPHLEAENKTIGIVTAAQGQRWYELTLTGVESHAGTTPMDRRKDALLGAARVIELVRQIGSSRSPLAYATVGMIEAYPNSRNVIPGRVFLTMDFRHVSDADLAGMGREMQGGVERIANEINLEVSLKDIFYYPPVQFHESCVDAIRTAANVCGYSARDIVSAAGHDACYISRVAPTGMIFVPCIEGISHNEAEDAKPEWVTAGCDVLLEAMLSKATSNNYT